ncbi:MAG: sigma-70 family RNA polymerase sigma factor [Micromonosporaceae bacterium]
MRDPATQDSFDEFYRGTRTRVLEYLYAAGGDLAEAQDAAQEAFTRAWQRWAQVSACADPEAWVRVVGWRVLANRWRTLRGRRAAYRRHGVPDAAPPPRDATVAQAAVLRQLPVEQRVAVVLHHIVGLPVAEIATETGVPVGTVKARLSRGRHALAALLTERTAEADRA